MLLHIIKSRIIEVPDQDRGLAAIMVGWKPGRLIPKGFQAFCVLNLPKNSGRASRALHIIKSLIMLSLEAGTGFRTDPAHY